MTIERKTEANLVTITLGKSFDFDSVADFRTAYTGTEGQRYLIDFRNTDYMDSSGLGMLLNMRRHLGNDQVSVELINCRPQIKRILKISRFETMFRIS